MITVDEALMKADDANYSSETEITLAAEVRRLREETARLRGWIREEGNRNNTCIRPILYETCENCGCNQATIYAARSAK